MKKLLITLILASLASVASAEWLATLCPVSLTNQTAALYGNDPQHIKGASGAIYKACWAPHELPNSGTHTNVSIQALETFLPIFPTLGKSVAIHGITDPAAFLNSLGATRCNPDGTIPKEE